MSTIVDLHGLPAVRRMLATVDDKERINRERRGVRAAGNIFKPALSATAAAHHGSGSNVPASFTKVRVRVSMSNRNGRVATAIVKPLSPLFNIFEPGAGAHTISPKGQALAGFGGGFTFWTPGSRKRGRSFYARGPVRHPGFRSRAILPTAFAASVEAATTAAVDVIFGHAPGAAVGSGQ